MSTQKYQALVRAVEKGSLSRAAEELGYTQSGISHMMKSLEDEVGFPLMVRTSVGIRLNPEGEMLMPLIRQLLASKENLEQSIAAIRGVEIGRIRIASFSSVAVTWLPNILRDFRQDFPNVDVQIIESGADEIEAMMENREADLCIYTGQEGRAFDWYPLYRDPLMAVLPKNHPLAGMRDFPIESFAGENFIVPRKGFDVDVNHVLEQMEQLPPVRFSSCNDYAIIAMVAAGLGVSISAKLILDSSGSDAIAIPLRPAYYRTLGVGVPESKTVSPATRNFMQYVRRYVESLA
ncbi:MAG: LysR family transcriptional regulator [Oscillospiraceae bacterium]